MTAESSGPGVPAFPTPEGPPPPVVPPPAPKVGDVVPWTREAAPVGHWYLGPSSVVFKLLQYLPGDQKYPADIVTWSRMPTTKEEVEKGALQRVQLPYLVEGNPIPVTILETPVALDAYAPRATNQGTPPLPAAGAVETSMPPAAPPVPDVPPAAPPVPDVPATAPAAPPAGPPTAPTPTLCPDHPKRTGQRKPRGDGADCPGCLALYRAVNPEGYAKHFGQTPSAAATPPAPSAPDVPAVPTASPATPPASETSEPTLPSVAIPGVATATFPDVNGKQVTVTVGVLLHTLASLIARKFSG